MALPIFYPFKTRYYTASSSSTAAGTIASVGVAARGKLIGATLTTNSQTTHSQATNAVDITVNGSTVTGWGGLVVTTSTGNSATVFGPPTATTYVKPGDVLSTVTSSVAGNCTVFIVQEF